jgi:hypothetical protein
MLDPIIEFFGRMFHLIGRAIGMGIAGLLWPFLASARWWTRKGWMVKSGVAVFVVAFLAFYAYFMWQTQVWQNFNVNYVADYKLGERTAQPGEPVEGQPNVCGRSAIVDVSAGLTDFNVNQNAWIPSMLNSKLGLFGLPWKYTPFFDNKAAFQLGINDVMRRTAIELVDRLGRVRGTSQIDQNLQDARQNLNYTEDLWYFAFDPFGPKSPTPTSYRAAIRNLNDFNDRLARCDANFDPRADNLLKFLEQMTSITGSTSDILNEQLQASDAGWFDFRADDRFWFAYGQLYALKGILSATESDFKNVFRERGLTRTWQKTAENLDTLLGIQPWIISNGAEDALIMPSHLSTMGFYLLTIRANMTEMRDILDR